MNSPVDIAPAVVFQLTSDCLVNSPAVTVDANHGHVTFTVRVAVTFDAGHANDSTATPLLLTGTGPTP